MSKTTTIRIPVQFVRIGVQLAVTGVATYLLFKYMDKLMEIVDPTKKAKKALEQKAQQILKQLGRPNAKKLKLTEYEMNIASQLIVPDEIGVNWEDIGGLDEIVDRIKETVILPFQHRHMFIKSKLFQPPKGILLHGPPGCGKTLLAKATAKAAGCAFINIEVQQLTDKWYGESQKLAAAIFSLAEKLQPSIIFIDEIDVFLKMRSEHDHEVTAMMKSTFMSLWDGLVTNSNSQIMVMGATNLPQMIDHAILRRMPIRLSVPMPNGKQRAKIIRIILSEESVEEGLDFEDIGEQLSGFSGSDLREMCRHASVARVREHINSNSGNEDVVLRPLTKYDLLEASKLMQKSKESQLPYMFNK